MTASATPAPQQRSPADDALHHRGVLLDLIDLGAELAQAVQQQALAQIYAAGSEPMADVTAPFDRVVRCVRRSVALVRALDQTAAVQSAAKAPVDRTAVRARIIREVEDVIQREWEGDDVERLEAELLERVDGPDIDDTLDHRPAADVISEICRDLGLTTLPGTQPWKRRTPADIAVLRARAAKPVPALSPALPDPTIPDPTLSAPTLSLSALSIEALRQDGCPLPPAHALPASQTGSEPPARHGLHGT